MKISENNGFTLLEILFALLIFTLGTIVIVTLFSSAIINSSDSENTLRAINLAQRKMEDVRNLSFTSIANEARAIVSGFAEFEDEVGVTEPETNLKLVVVNVYWTFKGDDVTTQLRTYVSAN